MNSALDRFGQFIVAHLRDRGIASFGMLTRGEARAPAQQRLQEVFASISDLQRSALRRAVVEVLDTAVHDVLFALQESHDLKEGIEVFVSGQNLGAMSDGLQGELFGENGWL